MNKPKVIDKQHQPSVSWFELFYDLIFVAVVAQAGKVFLESPTWETTGLICAFLLALFTVWMLVTFSHSLVPSNDPVRRAMLLVQMILLAVAALALSRSGMPEWVGFLATAGAFLITSLLFARNARQEPALRHLLRWASLSCAGGTAIVVAGGLLIRWMGMSSLALPVAGLLVIACLMSLGPLLTSGLREFIRLEALNLAHLEERFALFTIIIIGESFVGLLLSVGRIGYIPSPGYFILTFLLAYSIWAIYYNSLVPARMPTSVGGLRTWIFAHALLTVSMVAMAVEFTDLTLSNQSGKGLEFDGDWTPLPLLGVTAALALLANVAKGVPSVINRVQIPAAIVLVILSILDLANTSSATDSYSLFGALVLIANAGLCAFLRIRADRGRAEQATGDGAGE